MMNIMSYTKYIFRNTKNKNRSHFSLKKYRGFFNIKTLVLLGVVLSTISFNSYACTTDNAFNANSTLQPGQYGIYSAGQDMSPGTVIRLQRFFGVPQPVYCYTGTYLTFNTIGGVLYGSGTENIYQTGVQGLGVRFKVTGAPNIIYGSGSRYALADSFIPNNIVSVDVEFIIMGPLSPGVVNTSAFPVLTIQAVEYGVNYKVGQFNFTGGSFSVQQPTCTTPDYTYDLLTVGLTSFTGDRQNSPWIDTPIKLTNCPTFYGNNSNGSRTYTNIYGQNPQELGAKQPVVLNVSLSPNAGIIDSKNGIIGLDSSSTATGVGIQIGYLLSGNVYTPQNLASTVSMNTTTGVNTPVYTFPFGARMVRTSGDLAPGRVSSSMTYTVTYK